MPALLIPNATISYRPCVNGATKPQVAYRCGTGAGRAIAGAECTRRSNMCRRLTCFGCGGESCVFAIVDIRCDVLHGSCRVFTPPSTCLTGLQVPRLGARDRHAGTRSHKSAGPATSCLELTDGDGGADKVSRDTRPVRHCHQRNLRYLIDVEQVPVGDRADPHCCERFRHKGHAEPRLGKRDGRRHLGYGLCDRMWASCAFPSPRPRALKSFPLGRSKSWWPCRPLIRWQGRRRSRRPRSGTSVSSWRPGRPTPVSRE